MFQTNFAKYNSTKELYNERKKKYWLLFFIFTVIFAFIILFQVGILIEYSSRKEFYIDHYINDIFEGPNALASANQYYSGNLIGYTFVTIISISMFIWHVVSLYRIKKFQDFSAYSFILSRIYLGIVILQVITLIFSGISYFRFFSWDLNRILRIFLTLFFIIAYFSTWQFLCNRVIRVFYALKIDIAQRNISTDPFANSLQSFFNNQFGQGLKNNESTKNDQSQTPIIMAAENEETNKIDYAAKLNGLSKEQLVIMAQKLNIYGAEEFSREDLISKIIAIFKERENKLNKPNAAPEVEKNDEKTEEEN
ncbi:hypothetical protein DA803_02340 [[Mycoplasma] phocae]|uniref:Rho termination factor N-terminal domain-containing protein n=1 Tax=[Mycoplasma] phocae TaxID=142651 RepID=A0A2Z5IR75_9BACT|nr:hypothetical protein [[Mycoplasma] phocae]AXE60921.1 hypothetical protein DA803_02340 [[Mycoplasma] phocae]